ncbi:MAG: energy transducer TonB [Gammaproteobacteria bacterium]
MIEEFVYQPKNKVWVSIRSTILSLGLHGVLIFGTAFLAFKFYQDLKQSPVVNIKLANNDFDSIGKSSTSSEQESSENANIDSLSDANDSKAFALRRLNEDSELSNPEAIYLNAWQRQVESRGYFALQKSRLNEAFTVRIKVIINAAGLIQSSELIRSSGDPAKDQMALAILYQAAPFPAFPPSMQESYQRLEIIRDWNFQE